VINYNDSDISRLVSTLEGKIPDRVPFLEPCFSKKIIEHVLGRPIECEKVQGVELCLIPVENYDPGFARDILEFTYKIGQDALILFMFSPGQYYLNDGSVVYKNVFQSQAESFVEDRKTFKKILYPDYNKFISSYKNVYESVENNANSISRDLGVFIITGAFFQDSHEVLGFNNLMCKMYDDPAFIEEVFDFFTDIYCEISKFICRYDIPIFFYGDNIAYNSGPFINEGLFKKLYIPRMKKILKPALETGVPIIFDSDGDIEWLIPDLIEMGISALHPIDPGGMDIYKIKEKYGKKLTLIGNVGQDFPLSTGTVDDVVSDVKKRIKVLGAGGRYVLHSSHDIGDNVRIENFEAMIDTVHEFGNYGKIL